MLPGDSLEEAIWVVIAPDGAILKNERIYPNANAGLQQVRDLIERLKKTKENGRL
jgi:hypothetical protein